MKWLYLIGLIILGFGCTQLTNFLSPSVEASVVAIDFNINCNGQASCSIGQTANILADLDPVEARNIDYINSIYVKFEDNGETYLLTGYNEQEIIRKLNNGEKIGDLSLSFQVPERRWGTILVTLTIGYTENGEDKTTISRNSVTILKPNVELKLEKPWDKNNNYNFLKVKNEENYEFKNVTLWIYVQTGPEIEGTFRTSNFNIGNSTEARYSRTYQTSKIEIKTTRGFEDTETILHLPQNYADASYWIKAKLLWELEGELLPLAETEGELYLNPD